MEIYHVKLGPCTKCGDYKKPCRCFLENENARLISQVAELKSAIIEFLDIAYNSEGISGWHMNGDILMWNQVEQIEEFERVTKE